MSVRVMTWVWEHSRSKLSARLVLLAIADHANGDGLDAYPSTTQLMRKTGLSERGVQKAIAELVELGELLVSTGGGRGKTNRYRVLMVEHPAEEENPAQDAPFVDGNPAQETPYSENPAQETPYSAQETPHNATVNPAESAPGTKREPRATVKDSPSGSPARTRTSARGTRIPGDFAASRRRTPTSTSCTRTSTPIRTSLACVSAGWRSRRSRGTTTRSFGCRSGTRGARGRPTDLPAVTARVRPGDLDGHRACPWSPCPC